MLALFLLADAQREKTEKYFLPERVVKFVSSTKNLFQ
jgi:hypothetical protein